MLQKEFTARLDGGAALIFGYDDLHCDACGEVTQHRVVVSEAPEQSTWQTCTRCKVVTEVIKPTH